MSWKNHIVHPYKFPVNLIVYPLGNLQMQPHSRGHHRLCGFKSEVRLSFIKKKKKGSHPFCFVFVLCAEARVTSHSSFWCLLGFPSVTLVSLVRWPLGSHRQPCQTSISLFCLYSPLVYSSAEKQGTRDLSFRAQRSGHGSSENKIDQVNNFHPRTLRRKPPTFDFVDWCCSLWRFSKNVTYIIRR